jgi:hypothetical protein
MPTPHPPSFPSYTYPDLQLTATAQEISNRKQQHIVIEQIRPTHGSQLWKLKQAIILDKPQVPQLYNRLSPTCLSMLLQALVTSRSRHLFCLRFDATPPSPCSSPTLDQTINILAAHHISARIRLALPN